LAKGARNLILEVPNGDLYSIVKGLDGKVKPFMDGSSFELVRHSPDELVEDVEDVRLVTVGTRAGIRTTHNYSPRADGRTEVMIELEAGLTQGGTTAVNINLVLWTMTYLAIESAYLQGLKGIKEPQKA
jgi:hypothetical protein